MPTYEYACKDCGHGFEVVQSFNDDALTQCPDCQGRLRKVFSAAGIIFKGSGWHVKDYADRGAPSGNGSSGGDGAGSADDAKKAGGDSSSSGGKKDSDTSPKSSTSETKTAPSDSGSGGDQASSTST